jgi:hypothetical protein
MTGDENCWSFQGVPSSTGYGTVRYLARQVGAHVAVYTILIGPMPEGTELDHLCRRRWCCNPAHLEPVPHRVNTLRGRAPTAVNAAKVVCTNGHKFTPENTRVGKLGRACRTCCREAQQRYQQRRRNELA